MPPFCHIRRASSCELRCDGRERIRGIKRLQRQRPQLREGEILADRYRLSEVIGKGGFAKVWLAFDRETRQMVAVKVLHGDCAEDQSRIDRFRRGALQIKGLTDLPSGYSKRHRAAREVWKSVGVEVSYGATGPVRRHYGA